MAARLKTFCYSDGFHVWTVAASSRAKALQAWGVTRDLFKDGSAVEVADGPDRDAALHSPGELIERGLAVDVGEVAPSKAKRADKGRAKARRAVEGLVEKLADLDRSHAEADANIVARREALEAEAKTLASSHETARRTLKQRLATARDALKG